MLDPLSKLAVLHGTDKFGFHDYTPNYHKLFKSLRNEKLSLLEIGVGGYQDADRGGQSLATWRDYFENAEITGIDIQFKSLDLGGRVEILQGSQVDPDFLIQVEGKRGPFDIIIDDGSHRNEHVVETFNLLWPQLKPGGIYVVEDVQTAFMPRFGGSLTLDAPNSVGFFAQIFLNSSEPSDSEVFKDVASIERFHNMIALRKRGADVGSNICAKTDISNDLELPLRQHPSPSSRTQQTWDNVVEVESISRANIAILGAGEQTEAHLIRAFQDLIEPGILVVEGEINSNHQLANFFRKLWMDIDHREIAVHFPDAEFVDIAKMVYCIEKHADGLVLHKAPNDYPSNFAFDPKQPQAEAAMRAIEDELSSSGDEGGLVQYASMLTALHGREIAKPWIERLSELGASSREFYQLAGGLAQRERRFSDAAEIFQDALLHYENDPQFALGAGTVLLAADRPLDAIALVDSAVAAHPRNTNLKILRARLASRVEQHDEAIEIARSAVDIAADSHKPSATITLAECMEAAKRFDQAKETIATLIDMDTNFSARAYRLLSKIEFSIGDSGRAISAIDEALKINPKSNEYLAWREKIQNAPQSGAAV